MNGHFVAGPAPLLSRQGRIAFLRQPLSQEESEEFKQVRMLAPNRIGPNDFRMAIISGYLHILKYLISQGDPLSFDFKEWVYYASQHNHLEIIKYFLSIGIQGGEESIPFFSKYGNLEILKLLVLSFGINERGLFSAFRDACANGRLRVLRFLMAEGANISFLSATFAAGRGQCGVVKYLFSQGVGVFPNAELYIPKDLREKASESIKFFKLNMKERDKKANAFLRSLYFLQLVKKI